MNYKRIYPLVIFLVIFWFRYCSQRNIIGSELYTESRQLQTNTHTRTSCSYYFVLEVRMKYHSERLFSKRRYCYIGYAVIKNRRKSRFLDSILFIQHSKRWKQRWMAWINIFIYHGKIIWDIYEMIFWCNAIMVLRILYLFALSKQMFKVEFLRTCKKKYSI